MKNLTKSILQVMTQDKKPEQLNESVLYSVVMNAAKSEVKHEKDFKGLMGLMENPEFKEKAITKYFSDLGWKIHSISSSGSDDKVVVKLANNSNATFIDKNNGVYVEMQLWVKKADADFLHDLNAFLKKYQLA